MKKEKTINQKLKELKEAEEIELKLKEENLKEQNLLKQKELYLELVYICLNLEMTSYVLNMGNDLQEAVRIGKQIKEFLYTLDIKFVEKLNKEIIKENETRKGFKQDIN